MHLIMYNAVTWHPIWHIMHIVWNCQFTAPDLNTILWIYVLLHALDRCGLSMGDHPIQHEHFLRCCNFHVIYKKRTNNCLVWHYVSISYLGGCVKRFVKTVLNFVWHLSSNLTLYIMYTYAENKNSPASVLAAQEVMVFSTQTNARVRASGSSVAS